REAAVAGQFYPRSKNELSAELQKLFEQAESTAKGKGVLQALISPHAGYIFSGKVAASAFNQIPEKANYKRVFVLASSHQFLFNGASVYCDGNYETPLGEIKVDRKLAEELTNSSVLFTNYPEAHYQEHSLEVQLPFLQYKLGGDFLLVPIILGTNKASDCQKIAKVLEPYFVDENLFVISTDFSHYPNYYDAIDVDTKTAEAICSNQPGQLQTMLEKTKKERINNLATSLCGWTSILTLLYMTENREYSYFKIDYQNSGDAQIYGDKNRVVGYWSLAVYKKEDLFIISEQEQAEILDKTRQSITTFVETGKRSKIQESNTNGILNEKTGVFVSIYVKNKLRGCMGGFAQEKTLNELVQRMSVSAACDARFDPIKKKELKNMEMEISVLSPLKKIKSIDEIELGKHGIYIEDGLNTGTFLPQVATKTGWSREEFLGRCSRDKAGLGWNGWKTAEICTYEAIIFKGS
ncbi:AmmeMemoRadiSam system protein B, partial [Draconibacterium sp.]|nr:AmmeMemoRadiSam system protein B [Draconibacterium sp.]